MEWCCICKQYDKRNFLCCFFLSSEKHLHFGFFYRQFYLIMKNTFSHIVSWKERKGWTYIVRGGEVQGAIDFIRYVEHTQYVPPPNNKLQRILIQPVICQLLDYTLGFFIHHSTHLMTKEFLIIILLETCLLLVFTPYTACILHLSITKNLKPFRVSNS